MHDNDEDPNLWRSVRDRKPLSLYELSFDGKQYGTQLFGADMGHTMTTTRSLLVLPLNRSLCPNVVRIVERWCSTPCT